MSSEMRRRRRRFWLDEQFVTGGQDVGDGDEQPDNPHDPFQDITENKNLIFQLALIGGIVRLAKMPDGMKTLQILGKEFINKLFDPMDSMMQAAAGNHIAAWGGLVLASGIYSRMGMLPPHFNDGYHAGLTVIAGVDLVSNVIKNIFGGTGAFPSTLVFAKKTAMIEAAKGAKTFKGGSS